MVAASASQARRRKTKWVLQLRILFFIAVPSLYLFLYSSNVTSSATSNRHQLLYPKTRKLLSSQSANTLFNQNQELNQNDFGAMDQTLLLQLDASGRAVTPSLAADANCTLPAILEFPPDGLTRAERQSGWIVIHVLIACYCFWLIAIVCDDYFVPVIDSLCEKLKMKKDVAGATFMAVASSSSELFINCVATFVTEGDIGVGTIVGSAVFNILAVPACCGLIAGQVIRLDRWPVTRDCLMYGFAVIGLILTLLDGKIMWYEAMCLVLAYACYIVVISFNDKIARKIEDIANRYGKDSWQQVHETTPLVKPRQKQWFAFGTEDEKTKGITEAANIAMPESAISVIDESITEEPEFALSPWKLDPEACLCVQIFRWPIIFLLWATIPDCRKVPSLRFLTFFVCIAWIGFMSYVVAFMITVIGDTLNIPDTVMGLTFLAAGTSIPEAVSSVIVTNQGHGSMGISNSIGSNTFDILLCLGLPWFIKSAFFPTTPGNHFIPLKSNSMAYSASSLLSTLCGLYLAFHLNNFKLDWKIGAVCTAMYVLFLLFASMIELNVFFPINLPTCDRDL